MSVLYLLTAPAPAMDGTDAVFNEVAALQAELGGETFNLYPLPLRTVRVPRLIYGLHAVPALQRAESRHQINHIYYPVLHWFPVLGVLRKPIVYTVTATLNRTKPPRNLAKLGELARIVVSNSRDAYTLKRWGLENFELIPPGIDTLGISRTSIPLGKELILLMASAPWHLRHFDSKGVDVLLQTAKQLPYLKLVLLWRGLLVDELNKRVRRLGLEERVEIVNDKVDVSQYLARAHASVLLAREGFVVKAFPHSLVESLAAGKPVLISEQIPMADFVRQRGCGIVIETVDARSMAIAVEALRRSYAELACKTIALPDKIFPRSELIAQHRHMYAEVLDRSRAS